MGNCEVMFVEHTNRKLSASILTMAWYSKKIHFILCMHLYQWKMWNIYKNPPFMLKDVVIFRWNYSQLNANRKIVEFSVCFLLRKSMQFYWLNQLRSSYIWISIEFPTRRRQPILIENLLLSLGFWQCTDNVWISWIGDGHGADTEVFTASSSQFNIVAAVVVNSGLGQHSVVFDFRFSAISKKCTLQLVKVYSDTAQINLAL